MGPETLFRGEVLVFGRASEVKDRSRRQDRCCVWYMRRKGKTYRQASAVTPPPKATATLSQAE